MKSLTMEPRVSFVVPCYNLAHLLPECVHSILSQTFQDFEVLIMDDCSPDNTLEVARSFHDSRVKHIRNESNLGHLENYNKGIRSARGKYVWLISADDRLRSNRALETLLAALDSHAQVGYAFCPAMRIIDGRETEVPKALIHGNQDAIFKGRHFLKRLAMFNSVAASSGLVRKECYENVGFFPLDMPYAGDWYIWCILALHYDVAYFSEPMVNYRTHDSNMTQALRARNFRILIEDDMKVLWRMKAKVEAARLSGLARAFRNSIVSEYANVVAVERGRDPKQSITLDEFKESLSRHAPSPREKAQIRARVYSELADRLYWHGEFSNALHYYREGLREERVMPRAWTKYLLLRTGGLGVLLRKTWVALRPRTHRKSSRWTSRHDID